MILLNPKSALRQFVGKYLIPKGRPYDVEIFRVTIIKNISGHGMLKIKNFNTRVVVFLNFTDFNDIETYFHPGWRCNKDFRKLNFLKTSTSGNLAGSFLPMPRRSLTRSSGAKKLPCGELLPKISYGWSRVDE